MRGDENPEHIGYELVDILGIQSSVHEIVGYPDSHAKLD